jgi:hypothetical protein
LGACHGKVYDSSIVWGNCRCVQKAPKLQVTEMSSTFSHIEQLHHCGENLDIRSNAKNTCTLTQNVKHGEIYRPFHFWILPYWADCTVIPSFGWQSWKTASIGDKRHKWVSVPLTWCNISPGDNILLTSAWRRNSVACWMFEYVVVRMVGYVIIVLLLEDGRYK